MHYQNGREAQIGDHVVGRDSGGNPVAGILIRVNPATQTCDGQVVSLQAPTYYVTIKDLLHVDDAIPPRA